MRANEILLTEAEKRALIENTKPLLEVSNGRVRLSYDGREIDLELVELGDAFHTGPATLMAGISREHKCIRPLGIVYGASRTKGAMSYGVSTEYDREAAKTSLTKYLESAPELKGFEIVMIGDLKVLSKAATSSGSGPGQ